MCEIGHVGQRPRLRVGDPLGFAQVKTLRTGERGRIRRVLFCPLFRANEAALDYDRRKREQPQEFEGKQQDYEAALIPLQPEEAKPPNRAHYRYHQATTVPAQSMLSN